MDSSTQLVDIPKEAVLELIQIYEKHYKETLNFEEAKKLAGRLMRMFAIVFQPIPAQ